MDSGEITFEDILRKYTQELHANEIVLLSYYIAAINIEAVFDEINGDEPYTPFEGIVLTDTFESTETEDTLDDSFFGTNDKRLKRQQEKPITAIIGNPPYSFGQKDGNDDNQNINYPKLERTILSSYVKRSKASMVGGMYDTYVKALRWATNRLKQDGVVAFVTNGSFIDSQSADGLRASLYNEFNHLFIFNLRGNALGQGDVRKKEGGNVFGSGTRTTVAVSLLVKDNSDIHELHYYDIGDYLTQKEKLALITDFEDISQLDWQEIIPDENNDWINRRDPHYLKYASISGQSNSPFILSTIGVNSDRDTWVIGFSKEKILENSKKLIDKYNEEVKINGGNNNKPTNFNPMETNWSRKLLRLYSNGELLKFNPSRITQELYRPFTKKWLMYDRNIVENPGKFYSKWGKSNLAIYITGGGTQKPFSVLVSNIILDKQTLGNGKGLMRYDNEVDETLLFRNNDNMNQAFADKLGLSLDDTFAYVYGVLNSKEYQEKYANDLKKDLARIPIVKNKERYVEVGKALMDLHLNYEEIPVYNEVDITPLVNSSYKVTKMRFDKKRDENGKSVNDLSAIIFNSDITISNIPEKAYEYVVNGRSAIEWIIDQYQVKTDKKSGITDDPNDYSEDEKYIFNLLLRIINVSVQTVDLINSLPKFEVEE